MSLFSEVMGISLWIVPPTSDPVTPKLKEIITTLSKKRSSPSFHPHITLASLPQCVSLEEITACLLTVKGPVSINFEKIRTGETYFQSVFIAIEATQSILALHEHIHRALGVQPKTPEFPHLSLYYGNEEKAQIAEETSSLLNGNTSGGFQAKEIWVVNCEGKPESWAIFEKICLPLT